MEGVTVQGGMASREICIITDTPASPRALPSKRKEQLSTGSFCRAHTGCDALRWSWHLALLASPDVIRDLCS
uniref:Uncharacterized protein n=1 Tax=Gopherus evgoodei TaxID=1825980 RepID=A0A8C4WHB0_9SAUR